MPSKRQANRSSNSPRMTILYAVPLCIGRSVAQN